MARIVYVVARNQPLLRGYLVAKVGARTADGDAVEIKLDERRAERRQQQRELQHPERRRGDRRLQPGLESQLRTRGYARVLQPEISHAGRGSRPREPIIRWRLRSTRLGRGVRTWRRGARRVSSIFTAIWKRIRPGQKLPP